MNIQRLESIKQLISDLSPEEQKWLRVELMQDRSSSEQHFGQF